MGLLLARVLLLYIIFASCCAISTRHIRITCIGDSITQGSNISPCGSLSYVTLLQERLSKETEKYTVFNAGNSSRTMSRNGKCRLSKTHRMQGACSYWDTTNWKQALASTPDVVTIMLGTNDAKYDNWYKTGMKRNTYVQDFKLMLWRLGQLTPSPHIFVLIPPPVMRNKFHIDYNVINRIIPNLLKLIVRNNSETTEADISKIRNDIGAGPLVVSHTHAPHPATVRLIDIHALFTVNGQIRPSLICPLDGVHLTPVGNKLIADSLFDFITNLRV